MCIVVTERLIDVSGADIRSSLIEYIWAAHVNVVEDLHDVPSRDAVITLGRKCGRCVNYTSPAFLGGSICYRFESSGRHTLRVISVYVYQSSNMRITFRNGNAFCNRVAYFKMSRLL